MKLIIPDYVSELMNRLFENKKECYIVGGAIRNALLGLPVHDYDVTTNALPEEMEDIFHDYPAITTGLKHGTLTVINKHHPVEITTFRKDSEYKDHRHPDTVIFSSSLEEDCARRDFTINALCWNEKDGLQDFFEGQQDLEKHLIRSIRNPKERFEEDALRILRAIRFSAQLDFEIEEETSTAILAKKELLQYISVERIHEELNGILAAKVCADKIDAYREVFEVFIPELYSYSSDDFEHILYAMDQCVNVADLRMAILLTPAKDPHRILFRLKYSNSSMKTIQSLIRYKDFHLQTASDIRLLLHVLPCEFSDYLYYRNALDDHFHQEEIMKLYKQLNKEEYCWNLKDLKVNGQDIMALGFKGKEISNVLNKLLNQVMKEEILNDKEQLITEAKKKV